MAALTSKILMATFLIFNSTLSYAEERCEETSYLDELLETSNKINDFSGSCAVIDSQIERADWRKNTESKRVAWIVSA